MDSHTYQVERLLRPFSEIQEEKEIRRFNEIDILESHNLAFVSIPIEATKKPIEADGQDGESKIS